MEGLCPDSMSCNLLHQKTTADDDEQLLDTDLFEECRVGTLLGTLLFKSG